MPNPNPTARAQTREENLDRAEKEGHPLPGWAPPLFKRARRGGLKALITLKCCECSGWQKEEVRECQVYGCPLWTVRPFQRKKKEGEGDTTPSPHDG